MVRRRVFVGLIVAVASLLVLLIVLTNAWFISPAGDEPQQADAVVMLAGGRGERLALAQDLIDEGFASTLVIMNGRNWSKGIRLCLSEVEPFEVICPDGPGNTRGEAREVRDLADQHGWESIILVTSDFHMHRASTNVERCFDGTIYRIVAENDFPLGREIRAVTIEWAGTIRNAIRRGC